MARACHPAELGDVSSVWKGRSHHFSSSHPSPPPPVTRDTRTRINSPGRRGLALGRHSEQPPPPPPPQPAKTLGVSSWLPQPGHQALLLLQSLHQARTWTPVSPKDAAGRVIFKPREQVHCHPQTLQLGGHGAHRGLWSFLVSDRNLYRTDRQTDGDHAALGGQALNMQDLFPGLHTFFREHLAAPHPDPNPQRKPQVGLYPGLI